jgi:hypothetical protein
VRAQELGAPSREWRSRERITAVHLRRTGGSNHGVGEVSKRSRIRVSRTRSSQGESPRVGCSKSQSHEIMRSEDSHWIQVTGGPLDQEPHRLSHIQGVWRLRGVTFNIRSHEVPRVEARVDTW